MSDNYRVAENLKKLADIKQKFPNSTHVYMKRTGMDGLILDIPVDHAEFTIHQHPEWELIMSAQQMDKEIEQIFKDDIAPMLQEAEKNAQDVAQEVPIVPNKPSELFMCPTCEFIAKTSSGLRLHSRKHKK